jgi:AcrR family transcriptional regulator
MSQRFAGNHDHHGQHRCRAACAHVAVRGERPRDDILAAAEHLLMETGDADAVSIRGVAEVVGVTPPSIYLHFVDKSDLIFQVCQQQWDSFNDHLRAAVDGVDDPIEWLETIGAAYVRWGVANPEQYRVLFMSRPREVLSTSTSRRSSCRASSATC